mmetsp:Transcript_34360/g.75164  ORF Transcript_34360/g.75164 Transcript_34360/m.75164 type:complete len:359 (-) Transcript_34360:156-1232(-)
MLLHRVAIPVICWLSVLSPATVVSGTSFARGRSLLGDVPEGTPSWHPKRRSRGTHTDDAEQLEQLVAAPVHTIPSNFSQRFTPMRSGSTKHLHWDTVEKLRPYYIKYKDELNAVRTDITKWCAKIGSCISTYIEMEITYMRIRETKPRVMVEACPNHGFSTRWILAALNANGAGHLHSFDVMKQPAGLEDVANAVAGVTWTFHQGNLLKTFEALSEEVKREVDYVFIDMGHDKETSEWYVENVFGYFAAQKAQERVVFVSVHDVFNHWYPLCQDKPLSDDPTVEGLVVFSWMITHASEVANAFEWTKWRHEGARLNQLVAAREELIGEPGRCEGGINNMAYWCDVLTLWFEIHATNQR